MSIAKSEDFINSAFDFPDPPIDFVLVFDKHDTNFSKTRKLFETAMIRTGLMLNKETIGNENYILITAPFERLAFEAEQVKLEMNLKGVLYVHCTITKCVTSIICVII